MPVPIRCALAALALLNTAHALASDLTLGPASIQKIVAEQLFNQQGRWYLLDNGPCYAYFHHPKTHLTRGRLVLDAELAARVGIPFGDGCAGSDVATHVTLSATPAGKGSSMTLNDIRVDHIDDSSSRDALDVIQKIAPQALPEAFSFDMLTLAGGKSIGAGTIPVTVEQLRILKTETRPDGVMITFDLSLTAP
jgi:hypothetical protein